jgi:protein involved in polysaccharide export with SLBB domain
MKKYWKWFLLIVLAASGCTTKSKARAQAQAAFAAGQQQALTQMREAQRTNIRVVGNVRNPDVPWTEGMTLAQAIVAAGCYDQHDPRQIVVIRRGDRITIDTKILLRGDDVPLEPGDTIEIHP